MKLDLYLTLCTKINSKWIKDLNLRAETIKFREENREKFLDDGLGNDFLDMTPWHRKQTKKVGVHQTKKLLHSKGNSQQNEKATYKLGRNIGKPYT